MLSLEECMGGGGEGGERRGGGVVARLEMEFPLCYLFLFFVKGKAVSNVSAGCPMEKVRHRKWSFYTVKVVIFLIK